MGLKIEVFTNAFTHNAYFGGLINGLINVCFLGVIIYHFSPVCILPEAADCLATNGAPARKLERSTNAVNFISQ